MPEDRVLIHRSGREWTITVCPECCATENDPPTACAYCERGGQLVQVVVVEKATVPSCDECGDRGSGTEFAGCPSCGRIRPAVTTAAVVTDEMIERGAHALLTASTATRDYPGDPWESVSKGSQNEMREWAQAALRAALEVTDDQ